MKYNGLVNSKAFHQLITKGTAYIKNGQVPSQKQAFILSHFLTGKSYEFYVWEVSGDPYRWCLPEFFKELFNYCFLVDFQTRLYKKLQACYKNNKQLRTTHMNSTTYGTWSARVMNVNKSISFGSACEQKFSMTFEVRSWILRSPHWSLSLPWQRLLRLQGS